MSKRKKKERQSGIFEQFCVIPKKHLLKSHFPNIKKNCHRHLSKNLAKSFKVIIFQDSSGLVILR